MAESCELSIARLYGAGDDKIVRIDAKRGARLLGRIDVKLEDFAAAVMGTGAIPAMFTTVREKGPRAAAGDRLDPEGGIPGRQP